MTREPFVIDTDSLHAYADGQLGEAERAAIERHLSANPDAAAEVVAWQRQNEALRALFPAAANESVPAGLSPRRLAGEMRVQRRQSLVNVAAAVTLVVLGSGIGWYGRDYMTASRAASDYLIEAAVTAHALYVKEKTRAVEVAADAPNLMTWLSNRIATPIDAPDLAADGYTFLGGRLLPSDPNHDVPAAAAQLMYQNASDERVTLYITGPLADKREAWKLETRDGVEAYYWANDTVTCTIVADLPEEQLRLLGRKIFEQLARRPDPTTPRDW